MSRRFFGGGVCREDVELSWEVVVYLLVWVEVERCVKSEGGSVSIVVGILSLFVGRWIRVVILGSVLLFFGTLNCIWELG